MQHMTPREPIRGLASARGFRRSSESKLDAGGVTVPEGNVSRFSGVLGLYIVVAVRNGSDDRARPNRGDRGGSSGRHV
jgi:hypothetical protein